MESLSFVSKISPLLKSTSDDELPIPGYLYEEINAFSFDSPVVCCQLVEFLVERLEKDSCHIKLKTLKLLMYIVENGSDSFHQNLRKKSHGIACTAKYSGPADALHGNTRYVLVRKLAEELIEKLYDTETEDSIASTRQSKSGSQSLTGLGQSAGLQGFGNYPQNAESSVGDRIMSGLGRISHKISGSPVRNVGSVIPNSAYNEYKPITIDVLDSSQRDEIPDNSSVYKHDVPKKHIPGIAGGGWEDADTGNKGSSSSGSTTRLRLESLSKDADWSVELNLIADIVNKGGTSLLTRKEMESFTSRCCDCNCDKVIELVNAELLSKNSTVTLIRALQLVEQTMNTDVIAMDRLVELCQRNLQQVYSSHTGHAHFKAKKILLTMERLSCHKHLLTPVRLTPSSSDLCVDRLNLSTDGINHEQILSQ